MAGPGNLAGWCELHRTYGRAPLEEVLAPAIALAEEGFKFTPFGIAEVAEFAPGYAAALGTGAAFPAAFSFHSTLRAGERVRVPMLATLRQVAEEDADALYRGELGARGVAFVAEQGGTLTLEDLASVSPACREPVSSTYRGLRVHVPPPPCEGSGSSSPPHPRRIRRRVARALTGRPPRPRPPRFGQGLENRPGCRSSQD